jgi:hypothetical protein
VGERRRYRICNTEVSIVNNSRPTAHSYWLSTVSFSGFYVKLFTVPFKFCILLGRDLQNVE